MIKKKKKKEFLSVLLGLVQSEMSVRHIVRCGVLTPDRSEPESGFCLY